MYVLCAILTIFRLCFVASSERVVNQLWLLQDVEGSSLDLSGNLSRQSVLELRKTTESHRDGSRFSNRYSQTSSYVLFYLHTLCTELLEISTVICDGTNSDFVAACHELSMQNVRRRPTMLTRSVARFSWQRTVFVSRIFSEGCMVGPLMNKMALTRFFPSKWVFPSQLSFNHYSIYSPGDVPCDP